MSTTNTNTNVDLDMNPYLVKYGHINKVEHLGEKLYCEGCIDTGSTQ